ncbi:MAG: SGNH/GDSL hydrolase family protein [Burkholderiaceae bacterium]
MFDFTRNAARWLSAAAASLLLISCGGSNDTPEPPALFSTIMVVGASGTDTGNRCGNKADPLCFPVPPYAGTSTASSGLLFNQILAARYGSPMVASSAGGFNFAMGGARTGIIPTDTVPETRPNLQVQTDLLLQRVGFQANPQFLYIVDGSAFGNNITRVFDLVTANPALLAPTSTFTQDVVRQAATDIGNVITRLHAGGARHILLLNSSNLGLHPIVPATARPLATGLAAAYNGALATQVIPGMKATLPGLSIYYVDGGKLMNDAVADPAKFGFTNTTAPCYPFFSAPSAPICATPGTYMFWDELHPSAAMHALVAQLAVAAIGR